ncbi:plant intracellular Ras-group-related LRR 7 [Olea europaea subsp. europaea]|uniref:Plant intracellular Ras-group-related LRR 7 n=1 Tax=Olea europaea subsp. europaea TaxID=158383 RepID=A0A8S0VKR7_OLEEU|nr:plant intracellular Ras-group-related LRR 7 [Olea europaea subsp. europaea]
MKSISSLQGSNDNRIRFLLLPCLVKNVLRTFYFRAGPWVIIDIVVSKLSLWETGRISYFGKQNSIEELPASVCNLVHLKSLSLNNNNVRQVPPDLLKECKSLQNISLHGNPIVMDQFQQVGLVFFCFSFTPLNALLISIIDSTMQLLSVSNHPSYLSDGGISGF